MLKMFTTQLTGLLKKIQEKQEPAFEDGARLLAQAAIGDGHIYIFAEAELSAVPLEAIHSLEPMLRVKRLESVDDIKNLEDADRVLILSRFTNDATPLTIGKALEKRGIPFVSVGTVQESKLETQESLADISDVHIDLHLKKGLLPDEEGNRFGYPAAIAALYVYYGLKFTIDEILEEY